MNDEFALIVLDYQKHGGKRVPSLKRESSHRRIVLDEWGTDIVRQANELIGSESDTDTAPITSKELSEWIKTTLNQLGYGDEYWNSAIKDMGSNPEYDSSGAPSTDVAAYILRRDAESRWANMCGLTKEEQDIMLGHKRYTHGKKRLKLTDPNVYRTIAGKLKRYDPFASEDSYSINPRSYNLCHGIDGTLIPFNEYGMINSSLEPLILTVLMKNVEAGESIIMQTSGKIKESKVIDPKN